MTRPSRSKWANLQRVALSMWVGCGVVIAVFFIFKQSYNVEGRGIGLPSGVADTLAIGYGPVVATTFIGFVNVLFRTYLAIGEAEPMPLVPIKRGAGFFYVMNFIGVFFALAVLVMLSFHAISVDDAKSWSGIGASVWAGTTALVFARFFSEYAKAPVVPPAAPLAPAQPPVVPPAAP